MIAAPIIDPSQVADIRRRAMAIAGEIGFTEVAGARVGIVATELATNLLKFAAGGEILVGSYEDSTGSGVELMSLDTGPGIRNVGSIMRDGFSTAGSAGSGLGAIRRLSRSFDIVSWPDVGTGILARIDNGDAIDQVSDVPRWGSVAVPMRGESVCGDASCARQGRQGWTIFVADGLGHGPQAAQASNEAIRLFLKVEDQPLPEILKAVHGGLQHTRGAAIAVCRYDRDEGSVTYAGVGNIEARIVDGADVKRLVSHAGTAGHSARRIQEFHYRFAPTSTLIMHSDGLTSTWTLNTLPGLLDIHPTLAAAVLYRQFGRGRDDAGVIVVRADDLS